MDKTIRIDSEVWTKLQELAKDTPFISPNNIIRKMLGLEPTGRKRG